MASVTLQQVSKTFEGGVVAVCDLDLEVRDGEFLVLVGPSGCGKSTTLRMIAGLETITSGTLRIGDREVNDVHPRDRDIAMVFQNYALYPHMTVEQNLAFALKMRKTPKAEIARRVAWAAHLLGLGALLKRKPRALSGGQRQRVAVGRAIVRQPAVFLFDEPLSNLDAKLRVETRGELKRLHRQLNVTTVYVTHDQEEAMTLGDRVAVMADGVLRQCAGPLEIYSRPADRFVAGFLGMPPMNFVDGEATHRGEELWFRGGDVQLRVQPPAGCRVEPGRVVAGLRPEAVELHSHYAEGDDSAKAVVQVVEPLGSMMDVVVQTAGGVRLVSRAPASELREGATVAVRAAPERIHLFAPDEPPVEGQPRQYGANLTLPR